MERGTPSGAPFKWPRQSSAFYRRLGIFIGRPHYRRAAIIISASTSESEKAKERDEARGEKRDQINHRPQESEMKRKRVRERANGRKRRSKLEKIIPIQPTSWRLCSSLARGEPALKVERLVWPTFIFSFIGSGAKAATESWLSNAKVVCRGARKLVGCGAQMNAGSFISSAQMNRRSMLANRLDG